MSRNREPPSKTCLRILESTAQNQVVEMYGISYYCLKNTHTVRSLFRIAAAPFEGHPIRSSSWQALDPSDKFVRFCQHLQDGIHKMLLGAPVAFISPQVQTRPTTKGRVKSPCKKKSWEDEHRLRLCSSSNTPGASFSKQLKVKGCKSLSVCSVISGALSQQGNPGRNNEYCVVP